MNKHINAALVFLALSAAGYAAFPTNTVTRVLDIDNLSRNFGDATFEMKSYEDALVTFTLTNNAGYVDWTGYYARFLMVLRDEEAGTNAAAFTMNTGDISVSGSNLTFAVCWTNFVQAGVYYWHLVGHDTSTTNTYRTLGRGKVFVSESLTSDTD